MENQAKLPKREVRKKQLSAEEERVDDDFWKQKFGVDLESEDVEEDEDYNIGDQDEIENDSDNYDSDFMEEIQKKKKKHNSEQGKDKEPEDSSFSSEELEYQHNSESQHHIPCQNKDQSYQERMQRYHTNLASYCYVRPIHFEKLISELKRCDVSYVQYDMDKDRTFRRSGIIQKMINNEYFQIPKKLKNDYIEQDVPDFALKLFKSEDEKYQIDNEIQKLQLALSLLEKKQYAKVNQIEICQKYDILGNPPNESSVPQVTSQIAQRINDLQYVRTDFKKRWQSIDKMYFHASLDYYLYNLKSADQNAYTTAKFIDLYFLRHKFIQDVQKNYQPSEQLSGVTAEAVLKQVFRLHVMANDIKSADATLPQLGKEYEQNQAAIKGNIVLPSFIISFADEKACQLTLQLVNEYLQLKLDNVQQNKYFQEQFQALVTQFLGKKVNKLEETIKQINYKQTQTIDAALKNLKIKQILTEYFEKTQAVHDQPKTEPGNQSCSPVELNMKNYEKLSHQFSQLKLINTNQYYQDQKYFPMLKSQSPHQIFYSNPFIYLEFMMLAAIYDKIKVLCDVLSSCNVLKASVCKLAELSDNETDASKEVTVEQLVIDLIGKSVKNEISEVNYLQICSHFGPYAIKLFNMMDLTKLTKKAMFNIYSSQFDFRLFDVWKNQESQMKYIQSVQTAIKQNYMYEVIGSGTKSILCRLSFDEINQLVYIHQVELCQLKIQEQIVIQDDSSAEDQEQAKSGQQISPKNKQCQSDSVIQIDSDKSNARDSDEEEEYEEGEDEDDEDEKDELEDEDDEDQDDITEDKEQIYEIVSDDQQDQPPRKQMQQEPDAKVRQTKPQSQKSKEPDEKQDQGQTNHQDKSRAEPTADELEQISKKIKKQ